MTSVGARSSHAISIAVVTAILKDLLENELARGGATASVGDLSVTTLPPDRITTGSDERPSLNLFLYKVAPNTRWRNGGGSSLQLDLHYLLSAYGQQELQIEVLLGHAIQTFHAMPLLAGDALAAAFEAVAAQATGAPDGMRAALAEVTQSGSIERISIEPEFSSIDDISRLWSALQARFRPSVSYRVSAIGVSRGMADE